MTMVMIAESYVMAKTQQSVPHCVLQFEVATPFGVEDFLILLLPNVGCPVTSPLIRQLV